jgi:hypothetical protein
MAVESGKPTQASNDQEQHDHNQQETPPSSPIRTTHVHIVPRQN